MTIALPARAKVNLDLKIVGRRADGFHELETTMQAITLHDLVVVGTAEQTSLTCDGMSAPRDATNTILKAHVTLEQATRRTLPAQFHLHKRIPPGSGLGGASSDAAAALVALRTIYRLDVDLAPIAAEVGADVPFFLRGGRARAEGRGEKLTPLVGGGDPQWFTIAWPGVELSTAAVYRAWDELDELNETKGEGPNDLERAAERVDQRVADFARRVMKTGWQMTGSGSAFFKPCATHQQAEHAAAGLDCWTAITCSIGPWA